MVGFVSVPEYNKNETDLSGHEPSGLIFRRVQVHPSHLFYFSNENWKLHIHIAHTTPTSTEIT